MTSFTQRSQAGVYKLQLGLKTHQDSPAQPWMSRLTDFLPFFFIKFTLFHLKYLRLIRLKKYKIFGETCVPHYRQENPCSNLLCLHISPLQGKMGKRPSPPSLPSLQRKTSLLSPPWPGSHPAHATGRGRQPALGIKVTLLSVFSHGKISAKDANHWKSQEPLGRKD